MREVLKKKKFQNIFMSRLHPEVGEEKGGLVHVANSNSGDPPILFKARKTYN